MAEIPKELQKFKINIVYCDREEGETSYLGEKIWLEIKEKILKKQEIWNSKGVEIDGGDSY